MKIWLITIGQRLEDAEQTRTFLLARALIRRGHEVTLWTSAFDHSKKLFRQKNGRIIQLDNNFKVIFLRGIGYSKNFSVARYIDHWVVSKRFVSIANKLEPPHLLIISLPDHQLAYEVAKFAIARGIPYIVDVRDPWPDVFFNIISNKTVRYLLKFILAIDNHKVIKLLKKANGIVAMMEILLTWGLQKANRNKTALDRVFYLSTRKPVYPEMTETLPVDHRISKLIQQCNGTFKCLFIGAFGRVFDPILLVDAARILHEKNTTSEITFIIGGTGVTFEKVMERAKLLPNVYLTGWLNTDEIDALVTNASVGVIPCMLFIDMFPNKSFTYLSGGLPLLSSVPGELAHIIENYQIGLNFDGSSEDLAEKLVLLLRNPDLCRSIAVNTRQFFSEHLDSDITYNNYAEYAEDVVMAKAKRPLTP